MFYPTQEDTWSTRDLRVLLEQLIEERATLTEAELKQWVVFSPAFDGVFAFDVDAQGRLHSPRLTDLPHGTRFPSMTRAHIEALPVLPATENGTGKPARLGSAYSYIQNICLSALLP